MTTNPVDDCLSFFQTLVPDPVEKNIRVQIGCHFEEVAEMIDEITALDEDTADLLARAHQANHDLGMRLKTTPSCIRVEPESRVDFLDAIADQMVTAIGSAHMLRMDILGGFNEVNESNLSKFGEDGQPVFDENGKGAKGPNYRKAVLDPFV